MVSPSFFIFLEDTITIDSCGRCLVQSNIFLPGYPVRITGSRNFSRDIIDTTLNFCSKMISNGIIDDFRWIRYGKSFVKYEGKPKTLAIGKFFLHFSHWCMKMGYKIQYISIKIAQNKKSFLTVSDELRNSCIGYAQLHRLFLYIHRWREDRLYSQRKFLWSRPLMRFPSPSSR